MGRSIGKASIQPIQPSYLSCQKCGKPIHPRFKHYCWKEKEMQTGEWSARGAGAFKVIDYDV